MTVTFLGTGTSIGVPVITCTCSVCCSSDPHDKRFRSSVMIETAGHTYVIDCGPDFRIQMLREKVTNLNAVIFTHEHRDHIAGLDDVRAFNYVLNKKIDIYGTKRMLSAIQTEFPYIFAESSRYLGAPKLNIHHITEKPFQINGITFTPIQAMHEHLPIHGYRIGDFSYVTDANFIEEAEIEKMRGSKVVVLNALRKSRHPSHFCIDEAVEVLVKLAPEQAYLTHMSHFIGLHEEVNVSLPPFIKLAYDGLKITI
ncbi:MAG: MBL fold metallo-hydrolase [Bacteroidetes bacterium]|nr:MBL fold metallo-hydrolase [Bacteroidota bacterium]